MKREAFFDNAKLILIFLVVFGHAIQPLISDSQTIQVMYHWIYLFHMPTFIFLSGFFAKGIGSKGYIVKLVKKLVFPYLIFQLFYTVYYYVIGMNSWQTTAFEPQWSLWFLLSLFCWHLLLIVYKKLPPVLGVIIAFEIGIIVGYIDPIGHMFSLSRTFVFFPFFLIGYWLMKDQVMQVKSKLVKSLSLIIMVAVAIGITLAPTFSTSWLLGSRSFEAMGATELGGFIRFGVYLLSILLSISILAWIPRKQNVLTNLGQKTLYVYLLHGLFIQYFREADLFEINNYLFGAIGLAVISVGIVIFLSSKFVIAPFQLIVEGKLTVLKQMIREKSGKQVIYTNK